jgi:hypothetical protein
MDESPRQQQEEQLSRCNRKWTEVTNTAGYPIDQGIRELQDCIDTVRRLDLLPEETRTEAMLRYSDAIDELRERHP